MADTNISPSGSADAVDTASITNPPSSQPGADTQPGGGSPPTAALAASAGSPPQAAQPQGSAQPPQSAQAPTGQSDGAQQAPQTQGAQSDQTQGQNGGKQAQQSSQPTPAQLQQQQRHQQQIAHAGHFYKVAEALAGGPRYKESIDPNTGQMTRTQVPLSRGDLGMAIALEAITGALSGLAQRGPGATGAAAAAGFNASSQMQQQVQQQQDQQANADFTRHAQTFETNLRMLQLAQTMGQKDFDQNQQFAGQYKDLYTQLQHDHPEVIAGVGGEQDAAKYHATKDTAIPTGNVVPTYDPKTGKQAVGPAGNKLWQLEYAFVDPNFKSSNFLSPEDLKEAAKFRLPGFADSDGKPSNLSANNLPMRLSMALNFKHRIETLKLADQNVQDFYQKMGKESPNFVDTVQKDPTVVNAMEKFQPLLAATGGDYGKAIGELASGGNGRQADPSAAGKILNLYGGSSTVQKYDQQLANEKEAAKKTADRDAQYAVIDTPDKANAVLADPSKFSGEQVLAAQKFRSTSDGDISRKAYGAASARTQAEIDTKKKNGIPVGPEGNSSTIDYFDSDPAVRATITPENVGEDGINHKFLDTFSQKNPQLASLVDQIVHGHNLTGRYGLAKKDGQLLDAAVAAATGGHYDKNQAEKYNHTVMDFRPGGNLGRALINASTAFDHLANLHDAVDSFTSGAVPGFRTLGDWLESDKAGNYATSMANAPQELGSLYANGGAAHEGDVSSYRAAYSGPPSKVRAAVKQQAINAMDKVQELADAYYSSVPKTFDRPQTFLSTKAADNFTRITGQPVDPRLVNWTPPKGAPSAQKVPNGQVLYQHGVPVAKAQNGQWIWP